MPTISYPVLDITINLLIDSGSTSNFISNSVTKKLNLKKYHLRVETEVHGIGRAKAHKITEFVNVNIFNKNFSCYVLDKVCPNAPEVPFDLQTIVGYNYPLVQNFQHPELEIDLIIGLRSFFKLLIEKPIKIIKNSILLIPTVVGYIVLGPLANNFCPKYHFVSERAINEEISLVTNEHLSKLLKQFFTCENKFLREGVDKNTLSKDEIHALQFFQKTYEILPHPNPSQSTAYIIDAPKIDQI